MKNLITLTTIVYTMAILAAVSGCQTAATNQAGSAASKKEALLMQAGFKPKAITTPNQQEQVSQLEVDRVSAAKHQGHVYYVFPTEKKNQILVGNQAQFNAYKKALAAQKASQQTQEQQQMLQGSPVLTEETAGPRHIKVEVFDGFGPLIPTD